MDWVGARRGGFTATMVSEIKQNHVERHTCILIKISPHLRCITLIFKSSTCDRKHETEKSLSLLLVHVNTTIDYSHCIHFSVFLFSDIFHLDMIEINICRYNRHGCYHSFFAFASILGCLVTVSQFFKNLIYGWMCCFLLHWMRLLWNDNNKSQIIKDFSYQNYYSNISLHSFD